jgi:transcriptional regulator with XRE-family HTH domain
LDEFSTPDVVQIIGDRLRMERIDRGLRQAEVAVMFGVVYQTIERWEHNRNPIIPRNRAKILAFFGEK